MKLSLYEIEQYTDTKKFYITRLESIDRNGCITKVVVANGFHTKIEAKAIKKAYEEKGICDFSKL